MYKINEKVDFAKVTFKTNQNGKVHIKEGFGRDKLTSITLGPVSVSMKQTQHICL